MGAAVAALVALATAGAARADEGGASLWLPGNFGSFAAMPLEPGWSWPLLYCHATADAGASAEFPEVGRITAGLDTTSDFLFMSPTYAFATPVAGGQASIGISAFLGRADVSVEATLTGPDGEVTTGSESDARAGVGDLAATATLSWSDGAHHTMAYGMVGIPVGAYDVDRLAGLSLNYWSIDGGAGYTYFDESTGYEFSAVAGVTYNFENPDTDYRSGVAAHLDWAASRFLSEHFHAGVVGYAYQQVTGDSGAGATLGDFKSRVFGIGPQAGWFFGADDRSYFNLKGYYEFGAENRPEGWNLWLTLEYAP